MQKIVQRLIKRKKVKMEMYFRMEKACYHEN